jgi:hypothetical protein
MEEEARNSGRGACILPGRPEILERRTLQAQFVSVPKALKMNPSGTDKRQRSHRDDDPQKNSL